MKILTWRAISRIVLMNSSCLAAHSYFRERESQGSLVLLFFLSGSEFDF